MDSRDFSDLWYVTHALERYGVMNRGWYWFTEVRESLYDREHATRTIKTRVEIIRTELTELYVEYLGAPMSNECPWWNILTGRSTEGMDIDPANYSDEFFERG
jgi:hypothetical protein